MSLDEGRHYWRFDSEPSTRIRRLLPVATVLALTFLLAGCDAGTVARRAQAIWVSNVQNDRISSALSAEKVRQQWRVRDGQWFGKLGDGSLVCLDSPTISAAAIKRGRPYCCKLLADIALTDEHWRWSPRDTSQPYSLNYTVLVRDSSRIELVNFSSPAVTPPLQGEIAGLEFRR